MEALPTARSTHRIGNHNILDERKRTHHTPSSALEFRETRTTRRTSSPDVHQTILGHPGQTRRTLRYILTRIKDRALPVPRLSRLGQRHGHGTSQGKRLRGGAASGRKEKATPPVRVAPHGQGPLVYTRARSLVNLCRLSCMLLRVLQRPISSKHKKDVSDA